MLNSLPKESVLVFNPVIAEATSVEEAIILYQIDYWTTKNEEANRNFYDGCHWTFNSYNGWKKESFPFWSKNTIIRIFKKLEEKNLIRSTDKYNKKAYDQTKWYTINYDEVEKLLPLDLIVEDTPTQLDQGDTQNKQEGIPNLGRGDTQNEQGGYSEWVGGIPNLGKPIPEITPETTKEINQEKIIKEEEEEEEEEASASQKSLTPSLLKFKADFTDIEIQQAKKFINPSMFDTKKELNLSNEHFNRVICYMKMGGMKYISASEYRSKNIEIEKANGKDGKGNLITDKAFYIVKGISLSKRQTENADRQVYQLEKAQKNEEWPEYVKEVVEDEKGNATIIFTDEFAKKREEAHKKYWNDLKNGTIQYDKSDDLDEMGVY